VVEEGLIKGLEKAGYAGSRLETGGVYAQGWIQEPESVAWPGNGDIEQSTFFFDGERVFEASVMRQLSVCHVDDQNGVPFEAFGGMNGGEDQGVAGVLDGVGSGGMTGVMDGFQDVVEAGEILIPAEQEGELGLSFAHVVRVVAFEGYRIMIEHGLEPKREGNRLVIQLGKDVCQLV
jgi:hypothetical protein